MNERIFKTLSKASKDIMMNKVESIAILYIKKDGMMESAYDKEDEASALNLLGGIDLLKHRVINGYFPVSELDEDDE